MYIFIGEWFNTDTEAIISQALKTGGGPNVSDAYTINGLPGLLYNCSAKGKSIYFILFYFVAYKILYVKLIYACRHI